MSNTKFSLKHFWLNIRQKLNTRFGFFILLVLLSWFTNLFAYFTTFNLKLESAYQVFILCINPIATTTLLLSLALYIKNSKTSYTLMMIISILMNILLFSNVVYYREFSDFITVNSILGVGDVASGLESDIFKLVHWSDFIYWIGFILIIVFLIKKSIKVDKRPFKKKIAFAISSFAILFFGINLSLAEADRPQLLTRTFSHDYIVKYLGINAFTAYDGIQTYQIDKIRAKANEADLERVKKFVHQNYAKPNPEYFGLAKGRNVIFVHLESLQQFVIDYKYKAKDGKEYEVTPFLNSLFHSKDTFSFDNFFHQVGSGKTSDAETILDNSLYGLSQGAIMSQLGGKNTFQAAPDILKQRAGYTSAVFHGNTGTFWNRNNAYKHFGYDYFFDSSYFRKQNEENSFQYGLHDKYFLQDTIQYLQHLQQPFYVKFMLVSNHYPFTPMKGDEAGFPVADTGDSTVDGYFNTANYMDQAVKQLFDYLKASGLYNNSIIILYGDHYGISNSRAKKALSPLLGKSPDTWTDWDDVQMQRVPYMIHIPGMGKGYIDHTYAGQIDNLPTLLHLLGINTDKDIQLGQDVFSPDFKQIVAFRNGNFITPDYTYIDDAIYQNTNGQKIEKPDKNIQDMMHKDKSYVDKELSISDEINNGDLLRFYKDNGLKPVNPKDYNYQNELKRIQQIDMDKGAGSTSVFHHNNNQTTVDWYKTFTYKQLHPELHNDGDQQQ